MINYSIPQYLRDFRIEGEPLPSELVDQYLDKTLSLDNDSEFDIRAELESALKTIAELPQCKVIPSKRKAEWLGKILLIEPERLAWHARRLRGIGSSEIGTLVAWKRNPDEFFVFSTPRDIIAGKLMIAAPDGGSGDTRRGNYMEAIIRDMFMAKIKATSLTDVVAKMGQQVIAGHEWMVGNPDEIFFKNNEVYLADYKCPRQKTLEYYRSQEGINFDYTCQLHLLKTIADQALKDPEFKDLPDQISGMFLVSLDFDQWDVDLAVQEFDSQVYADILEIGDIVWNEYVLKGELPASRQYTEFDATTVPKAILESSIELGKQITAMDTLAKHAYAETENLKTRLKMVLAPARIGNSTMRAAGVNIKATPIYNHQKIVELLKRNNFEVDDYNPEDPAHPGIAIEHLKSCNEDVSLCMVEDYAFRLSTTKSGDQSDYVELCRANARNIIKTVPVPDFTPSLLPDEQVSKKVSSRVKQKPV